MLKLNQTAYIHVCKVLACYGMQDCATVAIPLIPTERLMAAQSPTTTKEKKTLLDYAKGASYPECVGALLYMTQTRPDCQYAISTLAQFSGNPGKAHFEAIKRVLRYLRGTAHFCLTFGGPESDIDLIGWTDSDWAQDPDTRQSVGGFIFNVAGGLVSWSCQEPCLELQERGRSSKVRHVRPNVRPNVGTTTGRQGKPRSKL